MRNLHASVCRIVFVSLVVVVLSGGLPLGLRTAHASEPTVQERGDALMKNVEDMMAHGGMGDARAIVHHCEAAAGDAEAILKQLPDSDPRRSQALAPLTDVIYQCKRVSVTGIHADPGQLLNPASKASAAARAAIKAMGLAKTN